MKRRALCSIPFLLSLPAGAFSATIASGGWIGRWSPGIGDPSAAGWLTVAAYLAAAVLCFRRGSRTGDAAGDARLFGRERRLWALLGFALLFLGINKQLDLQTAMTEALRMLAVSGGWYRNRRIFQVGFILALGAAIFVGLAVLLRLTRGLSKSVKCSVLGLCLILVFVLARASSFHHMDRLISTRILGLRVNWMLELGGIAVVILGTALRRPGGRRAAAGGVSAASSGSDSGDKARNA